MADAEQPEEEEGPPMGRERWKEQTKAIERVIDVILTVDEPRTASWIGDEALVSEQTAREHLDLLADLGVVAATKAHGVTKYRPDVAYLRFKKLSQMVERYDREELMDRVEKFKQQIKEAEEKYGVESPDELRAKAAGEDVPVEEVREYEKAASEWDSLKSDLSILQEALQRYDEFDRGIATAQR